MTNTASSRLGTRIESIDASPRARQFNIAMKVGIVVAFAIAILVPLDHLEGKAMGMRIPLFVGAAAVVPFVEWVRRTKRNPYPHLADGLVVAPFLVDTLGNLFGFYDNFAVTDDVLHCTNWILLVMAFQAFRFRRTNSTVDAVLVGAGFGALAIVAWEIMEWAVEETGAGGGLGLTYGDTIGDLTLSTTGGIIGAIIGLRLFGPKPPATPTLRR
jgi:hypothetical protein